MNNESEQAPPLPPRLQLPGYAQSRRKRLNRPSVQNELDVVPPPPSIVAQPEAKPNSVRTTLPSSSLPNHSNHQILLSLAMYQFGQTTDPNNSANAESGGSHSDLRSNAPKTLALPGMAAFSNAYYGAHCQYFTSADSSPVQPPLPPLAHSFSYPNIGSLAPNAPLLQTIQRQSMHRNSLQPAVGYTADKLGETLQKVQHTAAFAIKGCHSQVVLKKRLNEDLIDLDTGEPSDTKTNGDDLLQMFDPLVERRFSESSKHTTAIATTAATEQRRASTESALREIPHSKLNALTLEDDAHLSRIRLPKPSEYTTSSFYESLKYDPRRNSSNSSVNEEPTERSLSFASESSGSSSAHSALPLEPVPVQLPDNNFHVHRRPAIPVQHFLNRFADKLKRLRAAHAYDDIKTNIGFVIGARLHMQTDAVGSAKLRIHTPFSDEPICFTCSVSTSVEHVICHVVCSAPESESNGNPQFDCYSLRLHELDEYLLPDCTLGDFAYVQRCCKRRKPVELELIDNRLTKVRTYARTEEDDTVAARLSVLDIQPNLFISRHVDVNYDTIRILLDILDGQCSRLLKPGGLAGLCSLKPGNNAGFGDNGDSLCADSTSAHALLKSVHQSVKALSATLGGLETIQLTDALANLSELYLICAQYRLNSVDPKLNSTIESVHPEVMGSAITALKRAIYDMLHLYCGLYPVGFDCTAHPMNEEEWKQTLNSNFDEKNLEQSSESTVQSNIVSSADVQDTLLIKLETLCALNCEWVTKYTTFFVQCELVHGVRTLAHQRTELMHIQQGIFPRLEASAYVQLDTVRICALPRECKLICTLFGMSGSSVTSTSSSVQDVNSALDQQPVPLSITCLSLFDEDKFLCQGEHLLGMWTANYTEPSLRPTLGGPCREPQCPLLVLNVIGDGKRIQFPSFGSIDTNIDWNIWIDDGNNKTVSTEIVQFSDTRNGLEESPNEPDADLTYVSILAQRQLNQLDPSTQENIYQMLTRDPLQPLQGEQQKTLWERRHSLVAVPSALAHVLSAVDSWAPERLPELYRLMDSWESLPALDAMQLLLPDYADKRVRALAVRYLDRLPDDELLDLFPQLVYALRFETSPDCALGWMLQRRALRSIRLAHALQWLLRDASVAHPTDYRLEVHLRSLLCISGKSFRTLTDAQLKLLQLLDGVCERLRSHKCGRQLIADLANVQQFLENQPLCLPISAGLLVRALQLNLCTYFHSNSLPVKLVFTTGSDSSPTSGKTKNAVAAPNARVPVVHALYKLGDDLRQDALTMQMLSIMDKLWLKEGLDLKLVTFACAPTGPKRGFIQMVKRAETLRRIQGEQGVTGSFRDNTIHNWLRKHNPTDLEYGQAVLNFTHSCAGYAVATYILGIGDRHNDNIMLTPSGHLFHIDFGKFLGDAQMIGSIRRDRVPFVLTTDMAYVINGGERPSMRFQQFIDLCCQAYNILRRHCNLFLSLFSLMLGAGIAGVTPNAIRYVHDSLRPALTDSKACEAFNRLISEALRSRSTQINFFIHNLAQMRFSGEFHDEMRLSFASRLVSAHSQPRLTNVRVLGIRRGRMDGQKVCFYVLQISRTQNSHLQHVQRTHKEHHELYEKLLSVFRLVKLPQLTRPKASGSREVAERRRSEVEAFWQGLFQLAPEILHSDLVYTFLQTLERDQVFGDDAKQRFEIASGDEPLDEQSLEADEELLRLARIGAGDWQLDALMDAQAGSKGRRTLNRNTCGLTGELKLSLCYKKHSLLVMVMHAKNLLSARYSSPDTYVKTYLLPDPVKMTKRKTRVCSRNAHPTFLEMIAYEIPLQQLLRRTLEVSVWDYDSIGENLLIGAVSIALNDLQLENEQEITSWYPLQYEERRKDRRF